MPCANQPNGDACGEFPDDVGERGKQGKPILGEYEFKVRRA